VKTASFSPHRSGKALELAKRRVRRIAKGSTINGTYGLLPNDALEAFRKDLLLIAGEE
jgi:hypothetical protein